MVIRTRRNTYATSDTSSATTNARGRRSRSSPPPARRGRAVSTRPRRGRSTPARSVRGTTVTPARASIRRATMIVPDSNTPPATSNAAARRPSTPRFNRSGSVSFLDDDGIIERGRRISGTPARGRSVNQRRATPWADPMDGMDEVEEADDAVDGTAAASMAAARMPRADDDSEDVELVDREGAATPLSLWESLYGDVGFVERKPPVTNPFAGDVDLTTKAGRETWKHATSLPRGFKALDLVIKNKSEWWNMHLTKNQAQSWKSTLVPNKGTGLIRSPPAGLKVIADSNLCIDFSDRRNVCSRDKADQMSLDACLAFSSWMYGGPDQKLEKRVLSDGEDMVHVSLDLEAPGVLGVFNRAKNSLRQDDEMLFEFLKNATTADGWKLVEDKKQLWQYWSDEELRYVNSGVVVFKLQLDIMNPFTLHFPTKLMDIITKITLKDKQYNYLQMIAEMQDAQRRIWKEHDKELCSDILFMAHLWRALDLEDPVHNAVFRTEGLLMRSRYYQQSPGYDKAFIISGLQAIYVNLNENGEWSASYGKTSMKKPNSIVALATNQKKLEKSFKVLKADQEKLKSGQFPVVKPVPVKPAFVDVEAWRTTKTEQYVTGPSDGLKYEWCLGPHGTYRGGMYMKYPHVHQEWLNNKLNSKRAAASSANIGPAAKKGKLTIDKNTQQAALTTIQAAALTTALQSHGHSDKDIEDIIGQVSKE